QSALPSQLEDITSLATAGDWRAVRARLANQIRPLESLTSAVVEKVDYEVGEDQAQTVLNIKRLSADRMNSLTSGWCSTIQPGACETSTPRRASRPASST